MSDLFSFVSPVTSSNEATRLQFALRRALAKVRTIQLAKVISCSNSGGLSPVGTVDIQLLTSQSDSTGNTVDSAIVHGVPYSRIQGGNNAIIMDPEEGDIGIVGFGDRDLSAVIASKGKSAPGSNRRFSVADALWLGGTINGVPQQYIQFNSDGVNVVSPTALTATIGSGSTQGTLAMDSSGIALNFGGNGMVISSSGIAFTGEVSGNSAATFGGEGTFNGHTVTQHTHISASPGSPTSKPTG